jgi:ABC-type multidrug transport system fused ATPase/permease subunit
MQGKWNGLYARSAVSTIEQDIFLFALDGRKHRLRSGPKATRGDAIEVAAEDLHSTRFRSEQLLESYDTEIGERGVTLSGDQPTHRQLPARIAHRPAF